MNESGAILSPCRTWRYVLWRSWPLGEGYVAFIGLNPSTADETEDDPTIRRCINYAKAWGYNGFYMLNLFAYRATDPKVMRAARDPVGPDNDRYLVEYCGKSKLVVGAWGTHGFHRNRNIAVEELIPNIYCLGHTKCGNPKHPLYLRGDLTPIPLSGAA